MSLFQVIDWTYGPEIFPGTKFPLRWYPLMFVIGFFVGLQIMTWVYNREKKNIKELDILLAVMLFGAIFGARIGHFYFYEDNGIFTSNPLKVFLPIEFEPSKIFGIPLPFTFVGFSGLASHGAVFTLIPLIFWFSRKYKHNFMWLLDRIVITVAFTAIFIRIGNFFNHEIVGKAASIPWAVRFKLNGNDWAQEIYRHPAQLYESLAYLLIFLVMFFWYKRDGAKIAYGKLFGFFMTTIFGARFLIEFLKESQTSVDDNIITQLGLNIGQLLSVPMVIVGLVFLFWYGPKIGQKQMEADLKKQ